MAPERVEVGFPSAGDRCSAWHYPAGGQARASAPCVVMAHGFSLTRHDGLAAYAQRLAAAGTAVLAFDYRYLGDSGGWPRQRFRKSEQLADWRAAIAFARGLDGVDPARVVAWGFSFSGGLAIEVAADDGAVAATIALCPLLSGPARVRSTPPRLAAWITPRALADELGRHNVIPVTAPPGGHAAMTLPGESEGFAAVVPAGSPWRNEISPGVFATVAFHRPVRRAGAVRAPVWLGLGERDVTVSRAAIERFAARAAEAELHAYPYDHFGVLVGEGPARVAGDQVDFLRRTGLLAGARGAPAP